MKDRVLGVLFMAGVFALLGMGVREYLIHNGRLTSDLNADGHSITNLPDGFFPTNGFLRTHQDISGKADKTNTYAKADADALLSRKADSEKVFTNGNWTCEWDGKTLRDAGWIGGWKKWTESGMDVTTERMLFCEPDFSPTPRWTIYLHHGQGAYRVCYAATNAVTLVFTNNASQGTLYVLNRHEVSKAAYSAEIASAKKEISDGLKATVPSSVSNVVTKSYVESLGIESGLQSESDPHVGLTNGTIYVHGNEITPLTEHQSLSEYAKLYTVSALANFATNVDAKASTAISYLQGDDAKVVITNYDSSVSMPSMSFQQRIDEGGSNWWKVVWNELTRWEWLTGTYLPANYYVKSQIDVLLDEKADRAWGYYDSHGGNYAPDGYTWISSPKIAIAAGLAYQRTVTSGGAIWVLESNGLVTETGGNLTNGFFRVSDDDGNSLLEIVKGNKRTIGANAEQPAVSNIMGVTHMYIRYSVVSESHPTLNICTALELGDWHDETSADCAANVSWTGSSGAYVAEVWGKTALTRMFVKAEYEVGGETYIKNSAPISADGGIYCTDGIHKVRFVYNNGSVTMEVTP